MKSYIKVKMKNLLTKYWQALTPFNKIDNESPTYTQDSYNHTKSSPYITIKALQNLRLGFGSIFNDFCWISAKFGVVIGENTLIGPYTIIHSANHIIKNIDIEQNGGDDKSWWKMQGLSQRITGEKIIIGNDVWIGARVTILAGAIIPDKCVIGAGSIITKSNSKKLCRGDIVCNDIKLRILGNRQDYT